jgi:hypothetical protein
LLDVVAGNYLDTVGEREFDAPLIALLRSHGFSDIHFLHGTFEFGKDIIAKNSDRSVQYVVQSKAGNINLAQWVAMRGQMDLLRTNELAHPSFDPEIPRVAILVLTGRLTGGAPLEVQEYKKRALERGEAPLEVWDREHLIEMMVASPGAGLAGTVEGPLLELLGHIDSRRGTDVELEKYSLRWIQHDGVLAWAAVLEASIIAAQLLRAERIDLACITAIALLRGLWVSVHGVEPEPEQARIQAALGRDMFVAHVELLWDQCNDELLNARNLIGSDAEGIFLTYPVRCLRLVELLGLYALSIEQDQRTEIGEWILRFLRAQPGATHPISDRWAVSLVPALIAVGRQNNAERELFIQEVVRWLGQRHEDGNLGLAPPDATPDEESEYLLGSALEHVERSPRRTSYLSAVVLDLCAALELPTSYDIARNDIAAVGLTPQVPIPNDDVDQYLAADADVPLDTSPRYVGRWSDGKNWRMAPHHDEDLNRYYLGRISRLWDQLAISLLVRDRHWVAAIRALNASS